MLVEASIFPVVPGANVYIPTLMTAEKIAEGMAGVGDGRRMVRLRRCWLLIDWRPQWPFDRTAVVPGSGYTRALHSEEAKAGVPENRWFSDTPMCASAWQSLKADWQLSANTGNHSVAVERPLRVGSGRLGQATRLQPLRVGSGLAAQTLTTTSTEPRGRPTSNRTKPSCTDARTTPTCSTCWRYILKCDCPGGPGYRTVARAPGRDRLAASGKPCTCSTT